VPMRLIFLADDFPPQLGGIQTYTYELASAVARAGVDIAVVASAQSDSDSVDEALPFPVVRVPTRGSYVGAALQLSAGAEQAARELGGPPRCLVATKWSPEGPAAIWAGRFLRRPFVLIGYGGEFSHTGGQLIKRLVQRIVMRRAALFMAISNFTADLFLQAKAPQDRVSIMYGGVRAERFAVEAGDVEQFRNQHGIGNRRVLLTLARLVGRKGHDIVLRAMPEILRAVPDAVYVIAGDGPTREPLEALVDELGLADSVVFTGRVPDERMAACYHACDLFVMPSRPVPGELAEGLGLAYMEAAACGKPSVGTRFGGIPDAIAEGETGLLVDTDDAAGLAEAVAGLLADPARAAALGEAARARVLDEFTWDRVAARFIEQVERINVPADAAGGAQ